MDVTLSIWQDVSKSVPMVRKKPTAGIVLAAGMSSRFGRPKQLLELGGKAVLEWTLNACLDSQLESIYLILGYQYQKIMEALSEKIKHPRLHILVNQNYRKGQSTSLQAGILEIRNTHPSAMFILGDQPFMDAKTINHLLECYWVSKKNICVPFLGKERGNPVIFSALFYDKINNIRGDIGARGILEDHPDHILRVPVVRPSFFHDIDTKKDFEKAQSLIMLKDG
jgi:molybdenum cofactor cytidylyltransferase